MMIYNPSIADSDADLSQIPAFILENGEKVVYWDSLNKEQCKAFFDYAMKHIWQDNVGSTMATEILGCLEDTYPDWVEEFENL